MTYTQAQIDKANAVNLEKFLRAQGETLVRSGKEYRWKAHDSLTVCGNKWFRHSQSKGGFPVDFVMEFYGKSFPEAVQMLTGETGEVQPEADPAPSLAFRLPLRNVTNANILNYLTRERKLSPSLVNFFIAAGDIYEDAAHHNVVFVGRDADGHPRYASNRGIREKFRQDVAGAEKAFGFAHRGTDKQLLVFEAPIDLLSFIELFPKNWQQHNYLSLGGVSGKALRQFLSERPDVERVFLCLDADKAGEDACKRLAGLLPDTVSVTRIQPCMKDWNDALVHRAEIPNRNYFKSIVLKEPPKKDSVKIIRMSDVELTPVEWLWKPYLPFGKLSVLQGNPGEGKTYFAMHLAAACTNGKLLPNMERMEPFNVIYQTAEDGLGDTVKPRLIEAGADLDRVLVIDDSEVQLTLSDERIEKAIVENNARLVIIDPIQAYLGADVDMNRANEVRPIFMRLGQVAQRTGCAILLIGHLNKAAGMQSLQRGLGSIDIAAAVRSVMFIGKLKHDPTMRILTHEKSSLAPPGASLAFSLGGRGRFPLGRRVRYYRRRNAVRHRAAAGNQDPASQRPDLRPACRRKAGAQRGHRQGGSGKGHPRSNRPGCKTGTGRCPEKQDRGRPQEGLLDGISHLTGRKFWLARKSWYTHSCQSASQIWKMTIKGEIEWKIRIRVIRCRLAKPPLLCA